MKRYLLTPEAEFDLAEIAAYLRQSSPEAAHRVLITLRQAMQRLASMPGLGHLRPDLADEPLRFWSVYSYLIIYRSEEKPIQILRILHGARDVQSLLNG
jgi:plasmid stabilization system protein ParE